MEAGTISLKDIFPQYFLSLRSHPKSRIRFGTRDLYVDVPWHAYYFIQEAMTKAIEAELSSEQVEQEWLKFSREYENDLKFNGESLVSVSLVPSPSSRKPYLKLVVKWPALVEYLEKKATDFSLSIERNGRNIMKVYKDIWVNFFHITGVIIPSEPRFFPQIRQRFIELLKKTGDYSCINQILEQLQETIKKMQKGLEKRIHSISLYTNNMIMQIQHLHALTDVVNIPAAYLLLRNLLESLVKLFVYVDIGRKSDPELVLLTMFLYEYEIDEESDRNRLRARSLSEFRSESTERFLEIVSNPSTEQMGLLEFVAELVAKKTKKLWINPNLLKEFCSTYSLDIDLNKLYFACSAVIHNQPPLPFFSLLEVKFFKHFLERHAESVKMISEKMIGQS